MRLLDKVWPLLQKTPVWVWGALASAAGFVFLGRRAQVAEQHADEAERHATEARLERDTAQEAAQAQVHIERADELAEEQELVRTETLSRVAEAGELSDQEVAAWLLRDAKGRVGDEPCDIPPEGWVCTRRRGHPGPCAAIRKGKT